MSDNALLEAIQDLDQLTTQIDQLTGKLEGQKLAIPAKGDAKLAGKGGFELFDTPVGVSGELTARAEALGTDAAVDVFGTGELLPLRTGFNSCRFTVVAATKIEGEGSLERTGLALSARGALSASLRYEHHLAPHKDLSVAKALAQLVLDSRLPHLLDLRELPAPGEAHSLERKLMVDFGLEANAGYQVAQDIALDVVGDVELPLHFAVEAGVRASLGLGLFEQMRLVVGRTAQINDGWVRVRLQRARERRLSFGVTFELALLYDLGGGLVALFQEAIDQVPTERLVKAAKRLETLSDPEKLEELLGEEIQEVVFDLVGEKIVATLDDVVPFAKKVVDAYASIGERVQGLWERWLVHADLGAGSKVVGWLEKLAALDPAAISVDTFLTDAKTKELLHSIEAISGKSLDTMLFSDESLQETLVDVSTVAREVLDFLNDTPADVLEKIQEFAERTGIASTIQTLSKIDSVAKLQSEVSQRIRNLAARLAGKAVDALGEDDLKKIQAWAKTMSKWLDPKSKDFGGGLARRIQAHLEQVKADYGLSIGFEIDRITRERAVLDLELDDSAGRKSLRHNVSKALEAGRVVGVVEVLAEAAKIVEKSGAAEHETELDPGFLLRECAFTSERVRSSATSILFNLAGFGSLLSGKERGFTRRIEQATQTITTQPNAPANELHRRDGRYAGSFQRGVRTKSLELESAVWHIVEEVGFGLDPNAAYDGQDADDLPEPFRTSELRLTTSWQDVTPTPNETDALYALLAQLGFEPLGDDGPRTSQEMQELGQGSRMGFEIRFDGSVLDAVGKGLVGASGREKLESAFLNTCYRYFAEPFVTRGPLSSLSKRTGGDVVSSALLISQRVRDVVTGTTELEQLTDFKSIAITSEGHTVVYPVGKPSDPRRLTPYFVGMQHAYGKARERFSKKPELVALARKALASRLPKDYRALDRLFSDVCYGASIRSLLWPSSMFSIWFWIALVRSAAPAELANARGVATLQWLPKEVAVDPSDPIPWSDPMHWRLANGLARLEHDLSVFPVP